MGKRKQMSKSDATINLRIAAARVHVERAICVVKTYHILISKVDLDLLPYFEEIVTICCALANLSKPILAEKRIF